MKFSRIFREKYPNDTFISILYYNELERKVLPDTNKKNKQSMFHDLTVIPINT